MMKRLAGVLDRSSFSRSVVMGFIGAAIFELLTVLFRFGFKMTSARNTSFIARISFGFRIHHGYIGLVLLLLIPFIHNRKGRNGLLITGLTLFVSDLVHHFIVLYFIVGSPEFDIYYPGYSPKHN